MKPGNGFAGIAALLVIVAIVGTRAWNSFFPSEQSEFWRYAVLIIVGLILGAIWLVKLGADIRR